MNFNITAIVLVAAIAFTSCGNADSNEASKSNPENKNSTITEALADAKIVRPSFTIPDVRLSNQVQTIYKTYLQVQSALAADKSTVASTQANSLSAVCKAFHTVNLPANQKQTYEVQAIKIQELAGNIGSTTNIKLQRTALSTLSDHVYELVKAFGNDQPVYQTHCPMAFDGKGAFWLSDKTEIRNPYYGSEMLECGEVASIVKK